MHLLLSIPGLRQDLPWTVTESLRCFPAPRNHFLASFHLQQVPTVHYPDKNRCLTVFLARLTPDHTINTSWSEWAVLDWNQQQHKVPYRAQGGEEKEKSRDCLLCGTAHHQPSPPSANLVGQPAPDFGLAFLSQLNKNSYENNKRDATSW